MITSCIAIAVSLTSYIPVYDCTGVPNDRCIQICKYLKTISPNDVFTVVSGTSEKPKTKHHVNEIDWGF